MLTQKDATHTSLKIIKYVFTIELLIVATHITLWMQYSEKDFNHPWYIFKDVNKGLEISLYLGIVSLSTTCKSDHELKNCALCKEAKESHGCDKEYDDATNAEQNNLCLCEHYIYIYALTIVWCPNRCQLYIYIYIYMLSLECGALFAVNFPHYH